MCEITTHPTDTIIIQRVWAQQGSSPGRIFFDQCQEFTGHPSIFIYNETFPGSNYGN